jgi:hypothetical protein
MTESNIPFEGQPPTAASAAADVEPATNRGKLLALGGVAGALVLAVGGYFVLFAGGGDDNTSSAAPKHVVAPVVPAPAQAPAQVKQRINAKAFGHDPFKALIVEAPAEAPSSPAETDTSTSGGPRVGSFDGGLGSSYLARIIGQKKAREIWFLCRQYGAQEALDMGLVNKVVPLAQLEAETIQWCREMLALSPMALRFLKSAMNADCDGQMGLQDFAGSATLLYYLSEEGREGKEAFLEKRKPNFKKFRRYP